MTNLAYPTAAEELKETLAKDQFIESLISVDMRLRIKQARPANLIDAVRHAVQLEAFHKAEKSRWENQGILSTTSTETTKEEVRSSPLDELQKLKANMERLEKELQKSSTQNPQAQPRTPLPKQNRECYECGSKYHLRNKCPHLANWRSPRLGSWGKKPMERQDNSAAKSAGPGLYIPVKFHGQVLSCLVDTGVPLSVLSTRIWENSDLCNPVRLQSYDKAKVTASGNTLDVSGTITIVV